MSDDRFSLDDILSEYSGDNDSGANLDINIDELLNGLENELSSSESSLAAEETPMDPKLEERRMELIQREIISKDYEHKYLGSDFKDVIDEEKRRKAAKIAKAMAERSDTFEIPQEKKVIPAVSGTAQPQEIVQENPKKRKLFGLSREETPQPRPQKEKHGREKDQFSEDDDEFRRKYEFLKSKGLGVKSKSERKQVSAETQDAFDNAMYELDNNPGAGRTFSEKAEDGGYEESNAGKTVSMVTDNAGLVTFTRGDREEDERISKMDDPLEDVVGNDVTRVIEEYERKNNPPPPEPPAPPASEEKTRGFTDVFDKIISRTETPPTGKISGNTDLIDGMAKAKKERLSRTTHISPIERKSISDIDLKLDGKIIPDTVPLPDEGVSEDDMFSDLQERRKKKVDDFVFIGDEADSGEPDTKRRSEIDDYESMDDALSIANDIQRLKRTMAVRLLILFICLAASLFLTLANESKMDLPDFFNMRMQPSTYIFINTIIGIAAAFVSHTVISGGLLKLVTFQSDCDTLAAAASVSSTVLSMVSMAANSDLIREAAVHEYIPLGIAALIFNTIGKLLILDRTHRNFKYISGDSERYAVYMIHSQEQAEVFTRGVLTDFPLLTTMRKTEMISDFMKTSYSSDSSDRFCRIFAPIIVAASILIGVLGGLTGREAYGDDSVFVGLSAFVGCLSMCACFSMMLVVNLPMQRASRKYSELQGSLIGFDSIDEFSDTNSVLTDAVHLFPKGSVILAAIKIFSDTRIDEAIVEAASLASQSGSIMMSMFYDVIGGKTELLNPVESYIYEDSMGLCGWINNKRVLLGNRELMINHSIEGMPSPEREREYTGASRIPVYLSISGELSAMFIIEITPVPEVVNALGELERNGIKVILRSVDSSVTVDRMADMFEIRPDTLRILPFRAHEQFEGATSYVPKQAATLACSGRFAAFSALILGTKKLRGTIAAGIALQAISILLGILLSAMMVLLKSFADLSVGMILIYNLIFTGLYLIINIFRKV